MKNTRKLGYQSGTRYIKYPEIRIGGKFIMDKYGAKIGDTIGVSYGKNNIVLMMKKRDDF